MVSHTGYASTSPEFLVIPPQQVMKSAMIPPSHTDLAPGGVRARPNQPATDSTARCCLQRNGRQDSVLGVL